jgi:hypothetical protein
MKPNNLTEFLNELVRHRQHQFEEYQMIERWKRLAYLLYCNGGFEVTGWGTTGYSGGIFKQGVTQDEALELIELNGVIGGASWYDLSFNTVFMPKMDAWIKELNEKYENEIKQS